MTSQPRAGAACGERPHHVGTGGDEQKQSPERGELKGNVSLRRIHELWQKCEEEQRRFRIQHVDHDPIAIDAKQRVRLGPLDCRGLASRGERPDAQPQKVRLLSEPSLQGYHHLPSVRGDLLSKLGRLVEAREFERAASLTRNARERDLLLERARSRQPI